MDGWIWLPAAGEVDVVLGHQEQNTEKKRLNQNLPWKIMKFIECFIFNHKLEGNIYIYTWKSATILKNDGSFWMMIDV